MAETRPPLALFDDETFETVADDREVSAERLREIATLHQVGVRDLPGVDDIVYEWRTQFHRDPLVVRTAEAYVLAVDSHVWDEFADRLDIASAELDALKAVHDRQARTLASTHDPLDSHDALVLTRP